MLAVSSLAFAQEKNSLHIEGIKNVHVLDSNRVRITDAIKAEFVEDSLKALKPGNYYLSVWTKGNETKECPITITKD